MKSQNCRGAKRVVTRGCASSAKDFNQCHLPVRARIAQAVAAAIMTMGAGQALAVACADVTVSSASTSGVVFNNCDGGSMNVTPGSSVTYTGMGVGGEGAVLLNAAPTVGALINDGSITGLNGAYGITTNNSTINHLTNTGTITGDGMGVFFNTTDVLNGLTNSGTISGTNDYTAIYQNSGTISGGINNSGTITSNLNEGYGLALYGTVTGGLTNSGVIAGAGRSVSVGGTLDSIHITGNDTAQFVGQVYAPSTPTYVDSGATYRMNTGQVFTVSSFANNGALVVDAGATGTINGDFSMDAAATFRTDVSGDTSYGKLVVNGTATLPADAKIDVNVADPDFAFSASTMSGIISATTLNASTFVTTDNSALFDFTAVLNGNAVDLTLAAVGGSSSVLHSVTVTGNLPAQGAARTLDQIIAADPSGEIGALMVGLSSTQAVSDAARQTLPLLTGGTTQVVSSALGSFNRVVQTRLNAGRGLSSGDSFLGDRHFWAKPFGSWEDQGERDAVTGYQANTYGLMLGLDGEASAGLRIGGAFAYARSDINGDDPSAPQNVNVDVYQLIGYGSYSVDERTELSVQVDVGQNRTEGRRHLLFAGTTATADYDSRTAHVGVAIARGLDLDARTRLTPSVRADYTWIEDDGYTETGAGALNLSVDKRTTEALVLGIDSALAHQLNEQTMLTASLGVGYDVINEQASISAAFAGAPGAAFVTYGVEPSPWLVRGGLGAVFQTDSGVELSARYDAQVRQDLVNQTASLQARWMF